MMRYLAHCPPYKKNILLKSSKRAIWKTVTNDMSFVEGREISSELLCHQALHFYYLMLQISPFKVLRTPRCKNRRNFLLSTPIFLTCDKHLPNIQQKFEQPFGAVLALPLLVMLLLLRKFWDHPIMFPAMLKSESSSNRWQQRWSHLVCCHL